MLKKTGFQKAVFASVVVTSMFVSGCSSSDDDSSDAAGDTAGTDTAGTDTAGGDTAGGGSQLNPNLETLSVVLDSTSTVPPANVVGATGEGSFSVDTSTGAFAGSVTVTGVSGTPSAAHIHRGASGVAGGVAVGLVGNADGTVWTIPEGEALAAEDIQAFSDGELYVNVHTAANPAGELRSQLVDADAAAAGSITITFRNTSESQPMTPPVVALHNAPDAPENGIRLFEVGQPASGEVVMIAEDGAFMPLVEVANSQIANGTVSAAGFAVSDPAGPLLPGASSSLTLQIEAENQVMSIVSMVVCTNDGFSGVDSRPLSADATDTFFAAIYDAGSETNVESLAYWVPPCGGPSVENGGNQGDVENGAISAHPGQANSEDAQFNFAAGSELLEVTVTRN